MHFNNMMWGWGNWWSWSMFVAMFVFWAGIIGLILWAVSGRRVHAPVAAAPPVEDPRETLKRRYAAGEIDSAKFEQMKRDLSLG